MASALQTAMAGDARRNPFIVAAILLAMSIRLTPDWKESSRTLASRCLLGALVLVPLGFFLGGVFIHGGDPGIGVILVPPGGLLLFLSVLLTARASRESAK